MILWSLKFGFAAISAARGGKLHDLGAFAKRKLYKNQKTYLYGLFLL
jgi:hypothetical protein